MEDERRQSTNASGAEGHIHTDLPPLDAPWCEICNALLTQAILAQEARQEEQ